MGSDKHLIEMAEAVCCSEQVSEDAKNLVGNSGFEQVGSSALEPPKLDIVSGSFLESEEPVKQPVPEQQCCLEMGNMVTGILTKDGAAIDVSPTSNQVNSTMCLSTEGECVGKGSPGATLHCLQCESESSCLPKTKKVSDIEYGVSGLCLNEKVAPDLDPKVSALKNTLSSGDLNIYSGDGQMPPEEPLLSSAAGDLLVEGEMHPALNCSNTCLERNVEAERSLTNVFDRLHEPSHLSPIYEPLTGPTELGEKRNDENLKDSMDESHLENGELEHEALNDQHLVASDGVSSVAESPEKEGSCALDSGNVAGSSAEPAVPLQSSPDVMGVDHESSANQVSQGALMLDGIFEAVNSINFDSVYCHEDTAGKGNDEAGNIGPVVFTGNPSTLRRSSRANKYIPKGAIRRNVKIASKKSSMLVSDKDFNFLAAAVRSKRSCSSRAARASSWGLIDFLSRDMVQSTGDVDQISGSVKSGGKSKRKNKIQASASSPASKGKSRASSGPIRLKVKLGNERMKNIKQVNPPAKTDSVAIVSGGNSDNQLDGMKNVEKSAMCQESNKVDVQHVEKGLQSGMSSGNDIRNPSDKEVEKSGSSVDDRYLNSGTSPDSEVINHIPDSQFVSRAMKVCKNAEIYPSEDNIGPVDNASPAASTMRRKKGNKKDKASRACGFVVQDRAPFALNINSETGKGNNICIMMNADLDSADLWQSKKLLPSAEAQGYKKSKSYKCKGKIKSKSKLTDTTRSDMVNSRKVKGDKWTLINKHPIIENGFSDQVHIIGGAIEAGKYGTDSCARIDTSSGGTSKDVSNLPVAPDGVGQPTVRPCIAWVCCDDCHKWRCIPAALADVIGDTNCRWTCKDNQDKAFADCSIPQEKSNAEINTELDISDEEDGCSAQLGGNYNGMKHEIAFPQQASWMLIKSNIFLHRSRKKQTADEIMVCHCKSPRDGKLGCEDECLNRMLSIECVQGSCPCGDRCSNQQFQKQKYVKLNWFRCGKKGYGLQALEDIAEGQFLIEYVGEVLDLQSYEARLREYAAKGHKHFYFMTLNGNEVIDACTKGNLGRFINHSCEPNCRTEKWIVNGEICIGLFAIRGIKKGEEVTFDYNYVRVFGAAAKKCYCGTAHCRGYIGGDPLNTDVIIQGDSDEEFPEPVVIYENKVFCDSGVDILTSSGTLGVAGEKSKDMEPEHSVGILSNDKDVGNKVVDFATVGGGVLSKIVEDSAIDTAVDRSSGKSEALSPEVVSTLSIKKPDISVVDKMILDSLPVSVDPEVQESQADVAKGRDLIPKSRPRMKISRPFKSMKSRNSSNGGVALESDPLSMHNKSQVMDSKPKKFMDRSANHDLETVDTKLGELLDSAGGICKRKDASRGYLRLLVLTSASGDGSDRATIQSTRDLSMILDAILKTKSRTVLTDIINKNGLQMLHMMMKKCRGNFNKIPILRKLLKVFEFLAEKEILTLEHINEGPSLSGVESFKESILNLTEHEDKKVHQIARNFRDRWIPRPVRKYNCMDRGDRLVEYNRGLNSSRFFGLHHHWRDQIERPSEPMERWQDQDHMERPMEPVDSKLPFPLSNSVDNEMAEGANQPTNNTTSLSGTRKRKSRWDQPAEPVTHHHKTEHRQFQFDLTPEPLMRAGEVDGKDHVHTYPKQIKNKTQDMIDDDDAPPGFSCPSFGAPLFTIASSTMTSSSISQQYPGPLKCPSEAPLAYPPERYNSNLPMAYGIPFNIVQEFGTPQAATADGWVIAPGMVFHPFPPLPLHPRKQVKCETPQSVDGVGVVIMNGNGVNYQQDSYLAIGSNHPVDREFTSTSSGVWAGIVNPDRNNFVQHERVFYGQGRRNSHSYRNNFRSKPPWGWKRNGGSGGGGFRGNYSRGGSGFDASMGNAAGGEPE